MATSLSQTQWEQYDEQGYINLGKILSDDDLAELQTRIDSIMLGQAPLDYTRMLMQLDSESGNYGDAPVQSNGHKGATLNYRKIQDLEFDPVFLSYMQRPVFQEICAAVYGANNSVSCFRAMFMNKPAEKGTVLPWHQDGGEVWGLDRDPLVTIWTALDPATKANGCVEVVPGTHKLGLLSRFGHTITDQQVAELCPADRVVFLELKPGEVVLLHNWLLHRSGINASPVSRRAFSVCYTDARTRNREGSTYPIIFGEGALNPAELVTEVSAGF